MKVRLKKKIHCMGKADSPINQQLSAFAGGKVFKVIDDPNTDFDLRVDLGKDHGIYGFYQHEIAAFILEPSDYPPKRKRTSKQQL